MTPQTKGAKLRAWIGDVRSVMGLKKKAVDPAAAERKEMLAALSQLRKEKEFSTRAINGEAFLKKYAKYKQEAAEVEDIVAVAQKEWGQHEAKTAYMYQMEKKADDHWNPGNKFDLNVKTDVTDENLKHKKLHEAEVAAIKTFTGDDYKYINPAVANQKDNPDKTSDWMDSQRPDGMSDTDWAKKKKQLAEEGSLHAAMMQEALKKLKAIKKKVYRGERLSPAAFANKYKVGGMIPFESFASASTSESVSLGFAQGLTWNAPADATVQVMLEGEIANLHDIQSLSLIESEKELLITAGTKVRVTKIEDEKAKNQAPGNPHATAWKRVYFTQA